MFQFFHASELIRQPLFLLLSCYHIVLSCRSLGFWWRGISIDPISRSRFGNSRLYPEQWDEVIKHDRFISRDCSVAYLLLALPRPSKNSKCEDIFACVPSGHFGIKILILTLTQSFFSSRFKVALKIIEQEVLYTPHKRQTLIVDSSSHWHCEIEAHHDDETMSPPELP